MIDFLKLHTSSDEAIQYFKSHADLVWCEDSSKLNFDRETIKSKTVYTYRGIAFEFHHNTLNVLFRPHYFFNDDKHNSNDFTVLQCIDVLNEFRSKFKIDLSAFAIQNIEFGINVVSPIDVRDLVTWIKYHSRNTFYNHKGLPFSKESYTIGRSGHANRYKVIKAYAKGVEFPEYCDANTFRFEVKSKQSKYIRQLGIYSFADLLTAEPYQRMAETILKEFDSVLILDHNNKQDNLTEREKTALTNYLNADAWYKYLNQNRNAFGKHFRKYQKLLDKTGDNLKATVKNIIATKLDALQSGCNFHSLANGKVGAISTIYKGGMCNHVQVCKVTGLNIAMQKDESTMLSHTGIKYYLENEPQIFNQLQQTFLTDTWTRADFKTQIKELAHNIRNRASNQNISERKRYPHAQLNLLSMM